MYGRISMIWDAIQRYKYATLKTYKELEIHFIHAKRNSLQLWSLKYDDDFYIMNRSRKIILSLSFDDMPISLSKLLIFSHACKVKFEDTIIVLKKLQKEHLENQAYIITDNKEKEVRYLRDIIKTTVYKLTESVDAAGSLLMEIIWLETTNNRSYSVYLNLVLSPLENLMKIRQVFKIS